jgi:hypothetical protein
MQRCICLASALLLAACGEAGRNSHGGGPGGDGGISLDYDGGETGGGGDGGGQAGCAGQSKGCYTVYAHGDHDLYRIDLMAKTLVPVGPFNAPMVTDSAGKMVEDVITDLAVSTSDVIYVISHTNLYTASATDGHVTLVGALSSCGDLGVALSFTPDGNLYTADFKGAFCQIDLSTNPPTVKPITTLGSGLALSGDLVAVADGTMYGTAYRLADASNTGTQKNNLLIKIDPKTGAITQQVGSTGFAKLFGTAYALGQVFGFTHDGTGDVVTIDPVSGKGTLFNSFLDPSTGKGISFAGAGVNADVSPTIN